MADIHVDYAWISWDQLIRERPMGIGNGRPSQTSSQARVTPKVVVRSDSGVRERG